MVCWRRARFRTRLDRRRLLADALTEHEHGLIHKAGVWRTLANRLVVAFRASRILTTASCIVALLSAGCGRADDERVTGAVTERFLEAVEQHDGARACAQLSDGAVQALEHDQGKSCARAAPDLDVSPSRVTRAEVYGTDAKVDLADGHSAFLELTPRGWRLSAAGCRPEPDDHPFTCEVQA
jgi:hypothetical protein